MALSFPYRKCRADKHGAALIAPRKIYIFPTRYGFLYGLLVFLILLISVNYANNPGFLLTFLLAGLGIVAMLHTWRNLVNLRLSPGRATAVFAGQPAAFEIRLRNSRESERPNIRLRLTANDEVEMDLPAATTQSLTLYTRAARRGRQPLPQIRLSTHYPLGLLRAWCYVDLEMNLLVYPAPGSTMPLKGDADHNSDDHQQADAGNSSGSDDFIGLRQYREGDTPRQINWKRYAREQGLHTNLFTVSSVRRHWLEWDSLPGMETEERLSTLCRGVVDASERQHEYGLRLPGVEIEPASGGSHRHRCLAALALFGKE
jgi:uncharacterized protein (DUF58 family)